MGTNALDDRRAGIDSVLTNLSIGIPLDQDFIGDQLLPPLKQPLSKVSVPVYGTEAFRIREDRVGDYSEPDKLDISVSTTLIEVDGHALEAPVSDRHQIESQRGPLRIDLERDALLTVVASMRLAREKLQADLITSQTPYAAGHKKDLNALGTQWSDASIDPLDTLIPMLESTVPDASGKRPTILWMGQPVWAALLQNPKIRDRIFGTTGPGGMASTAQVAALIGVDKILVGRAISRTVGGVVTKLWGKNAGVLTVPPTTGFRVPAWGYTVEQTVFGSASEKIVKIRDEHMGASGGDWIKRSSFYTPVSVFPDSGALFYNAVL